jgi:transcriptional regulator with XRE-family HTH domain
MEMRKRLPTAAPGAATAAAVLSKATVRAADQLGLRQTQLARLLGLSAATASRLTAGTWVLPAAFVRLYRSLAAITGGKTQAMRDWLHSDNDALGGEPAKRILSAEGLIHVLQYLDATRGRI